MVKAVNWLLYANIKTVEWLVLASMKTKNWLAVPSTLLNGLVFWAKMDESSGNTTDSVWSKVWTAINWATFATGKINNWWSFDWTTDYFRFADHADFDFGTGDLSVSFRIYQNSLSNYKYILNQRNNNSNTGAQFWIFTQPWSAIWDSIALFIYNGSAGQSVWSTNGSHSAGVREHRVFTRVWTLCSVYKDWTLNNTSTSTVRNADNNWFMSIWENIWQPWGWNWLIDELWLWKWRWISAAEASELYNSWTGKSHPFT